jgi:hypothetical protein
MMGKKELSGPAVAITLVAVLAFVAVGSYLYLNQRPRQLAPPFAAPAPR